ncbi:MAG: WbuC family cupin fold metalloprotein [Limisphaerales bacterium]
MNGFQSSSPEVWIAQGGIVQVRQEQLAQLKAHAEASPRQRARICAHRSSEDRLHEMLIVLTRNVYIRPHKHLAKMESFHVIEGSAQVVFFHESGAIDEVVELGDARSGRCFYFRIDDPRYHTQIITSDHLVFHETTNGPFNRDQTVFAPWAPAETEADAARNYIDALKRELGRR